MQVKDYSYKVLRFQQTTDASLLISKGLHWKIVIMLILQSILYTHWTGPRPNKYDTGWGPVQ